MGVDLAEVFTAAAEEAFTAGAATPSAGAGAAIRLREARLQGPFMAPMGPSTPGASPDTAGLFTRASLDIIPRTGVASAMAAMGGDLAAGTAGMDSTAAMVGMD